MERYNEISRKITLPFGDIEIYSRDGELYKDLLGEGRYETFFAKDRYRVYIGWDCFEEDLTYRGSQMKKGVYLGHNIGTPCKFHMSDNDIYIYAENEVTYRKVFWSFIVKYIFTKACLEHGILHLKATILRADRDKGLILVLGKGGSGKTTLADSLCKHGFQILSNTHCMLRDNYVWGINSWIRRREDKNEKYTIDTSKVFELEGNVKKIIIVEGNKNKERIVIEEMNEIEKYYYIKNFSAAISNYDLKEEVFDYMTKNKKEAVYLLKREDDLVKKMAYKKIYNVELDSLNEKLVKSLATFLQH